MDVDAVFEGARQFGERVAAERAARRKLARDARNARRRRAYAARPKPTRGPAASLVTYDEDPDEGCRCNAVVNPPCPWCEGGGESDA